MSFITCFLVLIDWKSKYYESILVIIDWLRKIVYYKLVKIVIYTPGQAKVLFDIVVRYYSISDSIINK